MSVARSQVDIKPLLADLHLDLSHPTGFDYGPDLEDACPLDLGHPHSDTLRATNKLENTLAAAQRLVGHHSLPCDQGLEGDLSIGVIGAVAEVYSPALSDTHLPHSMPSSTMADTMPAESSITAHVPGFGCLDSTQAEPTIDGSEDESPGVHPHGNSLEDPVSDEFGLISTGSVDGMDSGGKSKDDKADTAPPWSELKTKAGKERKRLPLACIACRRKKIRCSGEKPACKHCLRSRIPCVYKVTARKAAPRTDYMAMLDKRLKRMEERIIKVVPKNEQEGISSSVPRAVVKPAIPGTLPSVKGNSRKRGADEAFGHELDQWAKAPAKAMLESPSRPTSLMMVQESEESKLLHEGVEALPSREIQEHLADVFFENVYGQAYHTLHKPSYMRKLRTGALPPVLILSVCAMSARFSNHPKLNTMPAFLRGEDWASVARDIVTKRYEWPNITILTCLLILGLHEFATCHGGRSWSLGGQAIRMAFALQLHKDLEYDPLRPGVPLSFTDREIRRRTMWACFLMDRFNSSGTDRPMFIKEETLRIPLPIREKNFQLEDMPGLTENLQGEVLNPISSNESEKADAKNNMGVAAYIIKAIAVWGRVINYLNQGGKTLDDKSMWEADSEYTRLIKQAEDMATSLPDWLVYNSDNLHLHDTEGMANQFLFLHITIQQNILFLSRFAVSSPNANALQNVPKAFVTKAGAKAFAAANRISELLRDSESYFVTAPFAGYCAFLSSTVHIFGIFSGNSTIEATSKRNLANNVKFLAKMKRFWGMFHFMTENLREQYRTCADAARRGNLSNGVSSTPIFQYGDWFDRYPHGVSHSDFVDPAIYKQKEKGEDAVLEQRPELHTVEEFFTTLSPREARPNSIPPRRTKPHNAKRDSMSSVRSAPLGISHQLESIRTDLNAPQLQRLQQQGRYSGVAMGGQTSGAASFASLSASPHSSSYHANLSPISPVAVDHHGQFANAQHPLYGHDMLSLQLAQNGMLPHLMLGPYASAGLDPTSTAAMMDSIPGWDGGATENGAREVASRRGGGVGAGTADGPHNNPHHTVFGHGHDVGAAAWLMPFNMEPPEVGDIAGLASALDGFGSMFGSGGAGLRGPGGGGAGGGGSGNH